MTVFVDDAELAFGQMLMCHMVADSSAELLEMADRIGVARKWIQAAGTYREHFDICKSKRAAALECGAVEITQHELALKIHERRKGGHHAKNV